MASITIRNLDDGTKERLRVRAAGRRRSMEAEARHILRTTLASDDARVTNLASAIRERFRSVGGVDLALPDREPVRPPPKPAPPRR
jgi:plasmid stability protein